MPPKNKPKNAPNQHDKRHESGLAPPGKRIIKGISNGHLNGQANGKPVPSSSSVAHPSHPSSATNPSQRLARSSDSAENALSFADKDNAGAAGGEDRDRTYSDASLEEGGLCGEMADVNQEQVSTTPPVDAQAPTYRTYAPAHPGSTLSTVSTILSYYPLRDAIATLILLLSLPPTLVLVIQTLFASLTFVPPTTSISLSTLPNIKEMFNSPTLGYPALATILIVDLLFFICWLPIGKPMQGMFLDLSQAVIAVSLSGATASSGGPTYSIATTTIIVCIVHVLRYKAIHLTAFDYLRSVVHIPGIGVQLDVPSFATNSAFLPSVERGLIYTVLRTILGIHIVSQGVTTCIRRSLVKANEQNINIPAITKTESEVAAGAELHPRSGVVLGETNQHLTTTSSTDGRPPGPPPAHRDSKLRDPIAKKKRKHANQVRSQQPLWAAIASTKVTFVKEMEQRDAADDAREAARTDINITNTTNTTASAINTTANRVWIREVRDTGIFFGVELSPTAAAESVINLKEGTTLSAGIDQSKPFFLQINGAAWSSTRIVSNVTDEDSTNSKDDRYDGEIFGLAPLSSYQCEIVSIASQNVLSSISIITQPAPTPEQAASVASQPQHSALRPSSPITTLKQSIQTAESKMNETRGRNKKSRKDQRGVHTELKREITTMKSKLEPPGGPDDKLERRLLQIRQHKASAEDFTAELKEQIDAMGESSADEPTESGDQTSKWEYASNAKRAADKELEDAEANADRELKALKSDICQTEVKREKLAARLIQRSEELQKLLQKQQDDMTAKQKRDYERARRQESRELWEIDTRRHIAQYESMVETFQQKTHDAFQEIEALQSYLSQPPPYPGYSSPPTPENVLTGAPNGALGSPQTNGFPGFGSYAFQSPLHSAHPSLSSVPVAQRGRSSSMLSQYSGFTENDDEYNFTATEQPRTQYGWPMQASTSAGGAVVDDRKESEGSGSASLNNGSTGSSSPRPDTRPFVPGKPGVGTIGPPSKARTPQSPVAALGGVSNGR